MSRVSGMLESAENLDLHLEEVGSMLTVAQNCVDRSAPKDIEAAFGHFRTCVDNLRAELDDIVTGLMLMDNEAQEPAKAKGDKGDVRKVATA